MHVTWYPPDMIKSLHLHQHHDSQMPPKHPYIHEAEKGAFLYNLDNSDDIVLAAKKARINIKTARGIKRRADTITHTCAENSQPPPSLYDRTIIAPKSGRRRVFSELDIEHLDNAIGQDRYHREMLQTEELDIPHASKSTIRTVTRSLNYHRVAPTKKLALTAIQEA